MRSKKMRNWLIVFSVALLIATIIAGSIKTDGNYAPGSHWPYIWEGAAWISVALLAFAWLYWWNRKV